MPKSTSTVDTTKTTTSTSSKQSGARRKGPVSGPTVLQQAANKWATMTPAEQNSFAQLTNVMVNAKEPSLPHRISAYNTYIALSAANLAADQPLEATAKPYVVVPALPDVEVFALYVNGTLTVSLTPDPNVPYPYPVAVKMAPVILAASDIYDYSAFKKIGSISSFSGTIDITDMVLSRYRINGAGYKIAIELMGVAPGGFHSPRLYVFGLVVSIAQEAVQAEPEAAQTEPEDGKLELG